MTIFVDIVWFIVQFHSRKSSFTPIQAECKVIVKDYQINIDSALCLLVPGIRLQKIPDKNEPKHVPPL